MLGGSGHERGRRKRSPSDCNWAKPVLSWMLVGAAPELQELPVKTKYKAPAERLAIVERGFALRQDRTVRRHVSN